VIKDRYFKAAR